MTDTAYKVSVVVPVFKTEQYLPKCLESLLDQTKKTFEIVVVDDCSPGNCWPIVAQYQALRSNIKYVRHSRNLGTLCARFTGTEQSIGDYICYLDADDTACPNFIEVLLAKAIETGAEIVGSLTSRTDQSSCFVIKGAKALLTAYANKTIPNHNVWTKIYRKDLVLGLENLRSFARKNACSSTEDLLFNVFCALKNPTYVNIPEVLVEYNRKREGSATNPKSSDDVRKLIREGELAFELIRDASNGFEQIVEVLIQNSADYNYRRLVANSEHDDFEWMLSYFTSHPGGGQVLSSMLRAAEMNRRRLVDKLEHTRKILENERKKKQALRSKMDERLSALRTALDNERQKGQALRSKMDERLSVRRVLSQKFERIGALNVLRWIFNLGAAARRAAGNHGSGRLCHGKKVKARFLPALRLFRASPAR